MSSNGGLDKPEAEQTPEVAKSFTCVRCSKPSKSGWRDSNGLCIRCNFNKMMGGEVV